MERISRIFQLEKAKTREKSASARKGFTLVEILAAVAIIGIMALIFYPNIINTLETRKIEGSAREVLTVLQRAKFQAVKTKLNHRVRFEASGESWFYVIEREDSPTEWNVIRGFLKKSIPSEFQVNVDFPNETVEFSPLGLVSNYSSTQNSIILQSSKLATYGKPDQRIIKVIAGGSIQYIVAEGE
jgi:prepilin-type N-terminal cleavage/methylation domain-containing protein